jgi:uncharacterized protein YyaL (SSP411 family)
VHPVRDEKAIVSWNAWMATGLLHASFNLIEDTELSQKLFESATRVLKSLEGFVQDGRLPHIVYGQERMGEAQLEDLLAFAEALQLWSNRGEDTWGYLTAAKVLKVLNQDLRVNGRLVPSRASDILPMRSIEEQDGATPASYSILCGVLLRQSLFEGDTTRVDRLLQDISPLKELLARHPMALTHMLVELDSLQALHWKVPKKDYTVFLRELLKHRLSTQIVVSGHEDENYEVCGFEACYLQTSDIREALVFSRLYGRVPTDTGSL